MIKCPKCDRMRITGPRYRRATSTHRQDALVYTCLECGYSEERPTKDQETASKKDTRNTP